LHQREALVGARPARPGQLWPVSNGFTDRSVTDGCTDSLTKRNDINNREQF
jgi:hypothetical protein